LERRHTTDGDGAWTSVGTTGDGATTELDVATLSESTGYDVRVIAVNSVGDSAASAVGVDHAGPRIRWRDRARRWFRRRVSHPHLSADGAFTLNADRDVEYLIVAGGGGSFHGGGGGGGGVLTGTSASTPASWDVSVGAVARGVLGRRPRVITEITAVNPPRSA
jgi:hypothetical protein